MGNCGILTYKAKDVHTLNRPTDNLELWDFARAWIQRFSEAEEQNVSEKLIYLWVTVNAWASRSVPDLSRNHEDTYLIHCMAKDYVLSKRFSSLCQNDHEFLSAVSSFLHLAPIFQALWLANNSIDPWNIKDDRRDFVTGIINRDPYVVSTRNGNQSRFPAFSPACALEHIQAGESIPADWPHLISMIYQVRCNLFHGGKVYNRDSDRKIIKLAYKILWDVWRFELPQWIFQNQLPWSRVLVRSGFIAQQTDDSHISLSEETSKNIEYLNKLVDFGRFGVVERTIFIPLNNTVDESTWLNAVASCHGGSEGGDGEDLSIMDTYMAGVVRWLNFIGVKTTYSCDGHGCERAQIECADIPSACVISNILNLSGHKFLNKSRMVFMFVEHTTGRQNGTATTKVFLDIAEWIYKNKSQLTSIVDISRDIIPLVSFHRRRARSSDRQDRS